MQKQILDSGSLQLSLRVYDAPGSARASVVIGGAMGVRQDYYAPFAEWLSAQGFRVTTFDYRGLGDSLPETVDGGLRGFQADLMGWARHARQQASPARLPDSAGGGILQPS